MNDSTDPNIRDRARELPPQDSQEEPQSPDAEDPSPTSEQEEPGEQPKPFLIDELPKPPPIPDLLKPRPGDGAQTQPTKREGFLARGKSETRAIAIAFEFISVFLAGLFIGWVIDKLTEQEGHVWLVVGGMVGLAIGAYWAARDAIRLANQMDRETLEARRRREQPRDTSDDAD